MPTKQEDTFTNVERVEIDSHEGIKVYLKGESEPVEYELEQQARFDGELYYAELVLTDKTWQNVQDAWKSLL